MSYLLAKVDQREEEPEALAANPHWLMSGRVAANGKAWGDEEDPTEDELGIRKGKGRAGGVKFRRTEDTEDVRAAREQLHRVSRGRDLAVMFGDSEEPMYHV